MMLDVKSFQLQSFLPLPYEEVLAPRLKRAHEKLQSGSGAGGEFTGWVHLPRDYDREEFARIQAAASRIRANSQALVVIGIGGSYLGARGVIDCLCSPNYNLKHKSTPNIYFIGNGLSSDALDEVLELVGHPVGGVCPFGCKEGIPVYLDVSLQRFETVFPAVGSPSSAIELNLDELYKYSNALEWIDVCKLPAPAEA